MKPSPETIEKIKANMPKRYTPASKRPPIDWSKPVKQVAAELGISLPRAYQLRDSYRRAVPGSVPAKGPPRGGTVFRNPEAELRWLLDTIARAERVLKSAKADFGAVLRQWRKSRGLKQTRLSSLVGSGKTNVSRIECGEILPREFVDGLTRYLEETKP